MQMGAGLVANQDKMGNRMIIYCIMMAIVALGIGTASFFTLFSKKDKVESPAPRFFARGNAPKNINVY